MKKLKHTEKKKKKEKTTMGANVSYLVITQNIYSNNKNLMCNVLDTFKITIKIFSSCYTIKYSLKQQLQNVIMKN